MEENEICTTEESKQIQAIDKETVHKICSGQVILNISIAMKELVENAIDAKASIIDIHLKDYGAEFLEVADNGLGIDRENFQTLTLKHFTSKIKEFSDLEHLGTLGFRGEALSSLCSLCMVEIITRHFSADTGTKISYDSNGKIIKEEVVARQPGTTVILKNMFSTLPVRRKQFIKNQKKEFVKFCNLLYAYCLLPSGIKYSCTHTTDKGAKTNVLSTNGQKSVRENIICIFGIKQLATLIDVKLVQPEQEILKEFGIDLIPGEVLPFQMECLISSIVHGNGRSSSDRQYYYINNRPCEPHKLMKLVNEVYKQFNFRQYPFVFLNITTQSCSVDVNITPDKRQIFLEKEKLLLAAVKGSLLEAFKDFPSTYKIQNADITKQMCSSKVESKKGIKRNQTEGALKVTSFMERFAKKHKSDESCHVSKFKESLSSTSQSDDESKLDSFIEIACKLSKKDEMDKIIDKTSARSSATREGSDDDNFADVTLDSCPNNMETRKNVPLNVKLSTIKEKLKCLNIDQESEEAQLVKFRSGMDPKDNESAEGELHKHISKSEFEKMDVIGQFNLGFVITRLKNDLFIVDQHASDEKYNFEQLQLTTVINTQKLVIPKLLELTAAGKSVINEHEEVFNRNGFYFKREKGADAVERVFLTTVPLSNNTVLGNSDVDEMIFMLQEDSSKANICRPSKIRAMFASRACRKSIMVGKALSMFEMKRLISHMGELEQPWNCPHGRPTMRHLVNLNLLT